MTCAHSAPSHRRRLPASALLAGAFLACNIAAAATATPAGSAEAGRPRGEKPALEKKGLHFVFDASESMCGYLHANDASKTLLTIIKRALALKDDEANNKVILVRQRPGSAAPSAKDISEAPGDFQKLIDSPTFDPKHKCAPFDGIDSNVDLMFSPPQAGPAARSLALVSDMQLDEKALTSFVDRFRTWAREQGTQQPVSAGIVTLAVPFSGRYFPISETDASGRHPAYALPLHVRPFSLLWFVVGNDDMATVRGLLGELGLQAAARPTSVLYGLQVLPVQTEDRSRWLQPVPPLTSAGALFTQPTHAVVAPNTQRDRRTLHDCARTKLVGSELTVQVEKSCRDGKIFFDTVTGLDVSLPLDAGRGLTVIPDSPVATVKDGKLIFNLTRSWPESRVLRLSLAGNYASLNREALSALSLDNDACGPPVRHGASAAGKSADTWAQQCAERLKGKVYRYDALVQQLADRAKTVLIKQIGEAHPELTVRFKH